MGKKVWHEKCLRLEVFMDITSSTGSFRKPTLLVDMPKLHDKAIIRLVLNEVALLLGLWNLQANI